jgi:hypothetical protein
MGHEEAAIKTWNLPLIHRSNAMRQRKNHFKQAIV